MRALQRLVRTFSPHLIFLQKTCLRKSEMGKIRSSFKYDGMIFVDYFGQFQSGGLALLWKTNHVISLRSYSLNHIDVTIVNPLLNDEWRFTRLCGFYDDTRKYKTWDLLRHLHSQSSLPWLCAGDFNEILFDVEKK